MKFADCSVRWCNTSFQGAFQGGVNKMDLSKTVACTALVIMVLLTAGHAFSQDKPPAVDEAAAKKPEAQQAAAKKPEAAAKKQDAREARERAAEARRLEIVALNEQIARRCVIKPVMTDAQIEACRVAYRLY